jgi:hypothetical protein
VLKGTTMVKLHLWNGSATKEAWDENSPLYVDDCKPEQRDIYGEFVQVTYGAVVRVINGSDERNFSFDKDDHDLLLVDGIYYGDFIVEAAAP